MAVNNRNFYAVYQAGLMANGATGQPTAVSGLQSVGMTTTFNLEQVFEIGQIDIYENIEALPDVELTLEKVLDGTALIAHLATPAATSATLNGRFSTAQAVARLSFFKDIHEAASGVPLSVVECSGMYVNGLTYTFPVDGNCTESVTLVGNDKFWFASVTDQFDGQFDNNGTPPGTGGVQRRENVSMANSRWPTEIPGISASGTNNADANGVLSAHIQTVTISTDLGREDMFELGRRGPYHKFANFPVEVTCSIEINATESGDNVDAYAEQDNTTAQTIVIRTDDDTQIHLGDDNRIRSADMSGGDANGGISTITYNFSTFNHCTITNETKDPASQPHESVT